MAGPFPSPARSFASGRGSTSSKKSSRRPRPPTRRSIRPSCLDDDAQGQPLEALREKEVDAQALRDDAWSAVGKKGFDEPRLFSAWLNTLRWNCVTSTDPRLFQSPWRAGIQVMTYQLEPLRKALLLPRVNLLIADDVGLGKTIEAGLIVRVLLMRQKDRRIVVAAPPSVVLQWRDALELTRLLDEYAELRAERPKDETKTRQAAVALITVSLQKRLLSSVEAFARTLAVHKRAVEKAEAGKARDPKGAADPESRFGLLRNAPGADDDRTDLAEAEVENEADAQVEAATRAESTESARRTASCRPSCGRATPSRRSWAA